ncbi:hypothetical protein J5N97_001093 [Dioscorea zingiberensis]|uniref:H15 domain-containing protein n=1 Tax=Dioscorea zingiberensis TaxID=325984 RepID=A0A9D5BVS1_9LILI|nr:hypothetical protein J5N97_001093 [Dioscorea zingiberensis]
MASKSPSTAPPHHPPRRSPDHPPYAMMIVRAIKRLGEEGGSTEAAISEFIKSKYKDLPCGHGRLLPYYLNKLTLQGEFTKSESGKYLIADTSTFLEKQDKEALLLASLKYILADKDDVRLSNGKYKHCLANVALPMSEIRSSTNLAGPRDDGDNRKRKPESEQELQMVQGHGSDSEGGLNKAIFSPGN